MGSFVFIALFAAVDGGSAIGLDPRAFDLADELRSGWVTDVAKALSAIGTLPVVGTVVAAAVAFLALRHEVIDAAALAAAAVLTFVAVHVVKAIEDRPRPPGALVDAAGSAFPSAHAAYSVAYVAVAIAVARALPHWAGRTALVTGALVLSVGIGLSRVYLHVHYLSDVLAGWGLSAAIFALCGMIAVIVAFMRQNEAARA